SPFLKRLGLGLPRVDVADAAHGLNPLDLTHLVAELFAQVADVHVYAAVEDRQLAAQGRAHQVFPFDDAPRRRQQQDEYLVLDVRQLYRAPRAPDVAHACVHLDVADRDPFRRARLRRRRGARADAAQYGLDARDQLARVEGLREVVVRADLQPHDAVDVVAAGREHQHGDAGAFRAQPPENLEAVHPRHHHV